MVFDIQKKGVHAGGTYMPVSIPKIQISSYRSTFRILIKDAHELFHFSHCPQAGAFSLRPNTWMFGMMKTCCVLRHNYSLHRTSARGLSAARSGL
jgi:hypothetical protein